jgi:type II secretory pathway pseudopilin PulG
MQESANHSGSACHGYVAILLVAVLGTAAATWFVTSLGANSLRNERERKTAAALALAKQALVGRAVIDQSLPGSMPCPDLITHIAGSNLPNDGIADLFAGINCPTYVGRLPWRTLGLADLRDADGERMWYALSPNFRDYASHVKINDATIGTMSVSGATTVSNIAAIVFAPGTALPGQARDGTQQQNTIANYLDGANATGGVAFLAQPVNDHFNDRLATITVADLIAPVEKRVANEITAALNRYFLAHSVLPHPAQETDFACQPNGDQTLCLPSPSTVSGMLPRNLTPGAGWPGVTFPPWFNANWRTSVRYVVAPECTSLPACSSTTFSALIDAGLVTPKVTLVVGTTTPLTARVIAQ